ncbi:MAG: DUF2905 domain-containing protein [Candidatus Zixiibacteriota bacterium]|nr:MAG: DUF2905 domain-containing protein [candidate division Zixibacteria bacterium]
MLPSLGKTLIILGLGIVLIGVLLLFFDRLPFLGKLPGDFIWRGKHTVVYLPLATMLLLSVILTILLNLFSRGK